MHSLALEVQSSLPLKDIVEFLGEDGWNYSKIQDEIPENMVNYVRARIRNL